MEPKYLAENLSATIRQHPHLGNVVTHISSGRWARVDEALLPLFTPSENFLTVDPLTNNILRLICDNQGTTGRIMQPFFKDFLAHTLKTDDAKSIATWVWCLRMAQPNYHSVNSNEVSENKIPCFERLAS